MSLAKLFHRAWNILRHNRLIWLLSLIYAAAYQVTSFLPEDSQKIGWYCGLGCLELWFLIAMVETDAGMVYATDQQLNEQPYSFREGWKFVRPRTVGLVVTYFLFTLTFIAAALLLSIAIMVLLYILTYLVTRASIAKDIYPITLVGVFIATFFVGGPALSFGIRAILLEQMSTFRGLLRGWAIYRRNFRQSLAANIIFFGLSLGIKAAASVITFLLAEPVKLSNLMGGSLYQLYLAVTMSLPGQICGGVVSLVSVPMLSIVMTLIYRNAIEQELHPENIKEELKQVKVQRRRWRIGSLKKKGVWGSPEDPS